MTTPIGRLAWRTPTGALLWEIWGRRKWNFAAHLTALIVARCAVHGFAENPSEIVQAVLRIFLGSMFAGSCLALTTAFAFISIDEQKVRMGYPTNLFLKPVASARLALVPMLSGGAVLAMMFALWAAVFRPLLPEGFNSFWAGAVGLSFFWWTQALGWSLPQTQGRALVLLLAAIVHLLVGIMPRSTFAILAPLIFLAFLTAVNGLNWTRRGTWERPSLFPSLIRKLFPAAGRKAQGKFTSAFRAQFWLEWQRQGCVLQLMCFPIVVIILPVVGLISKQSIDLDDARNFPMIAATITLLVPLMISGAMGAAMARFDPIRQVHDLPVYISSRPMTNGGFVTTKMAVALVSSMATWLLMLLVVVVVLLTYRVPLPHVPYGIAGLIVGCIPAFLLLVIITWNNLISGISAGLTGRPWLVGAFTFCKASIGVGLFAIFAAAKYNEDFKTALLPWLLPALYFCLTAKVALSVASFYWGLKRNAVTPNAIGWIAGGWATCGAFIAVYSALVCYALNKPSYWIHAALGALLLLPLADLALAPMAMAWNRHR